MPTQAFTPDLDKAKEGYLPQAMGIPGLWYIPRKSFADDRGFYAELTRFPEIDQVLSENKQFIPKQYNLSYSNHNVIRGFHAEAWNKLLTVTQGEIFAAWADIRPESPTFKQVITMTLSLNPDGKNSFGGSVFVSSGIANAFCVTSGPVSYLYLVDELYAERDTSHDRAVSLFDEQLAVSWPISRDEMVISERDLHAVPVADLEKA